LGPVIALGEKLRGKILPIIGGSKYIRYVEKETLLGSDPLTL